MTACSSCYTETPDGFRFCGACGAALPVEAVSERRERRVVSVLFADLVGFTSRSESADVEDVDAFLAPYVDLLRREVENTGGIVCKLLGDGVMAVFGAPTSHEDDPERAVRAGLGICAGLGEDIGLQVRVGVTSGEALVAFRPAASWTPLAMWSHSLAARVRSAARRRARRHLDASRDVPGDPLRAGRRRRREGQSDPVECWSALEPRSIVPEQARLRNAACPPRSCSRATKPARPVDRRALHPAGVGDR
jgi:hypothetical protein